MHIYKIEGNKYYLADETKKTYPKVFKGCQNSRALIQKQHLSVNCYVFARKTSGQWEKSNGKSYRDDKLFLRCKWFDKKYGEDLSDYENDVPDAPPVIELEDNEKFYDNEDNVIEIEVRGERAHDKCYFRVSDVMEGFGMKSLHINILNIKSGFKKNIHYVYLMILGNSSEHKIEKLFLTYKGLLRVLFTSRKQTVDKFIDWAAKTLFATQMGTHAQKQDVVANVLGISTTNVKAVFSKTAHNIPCIYLFSIGQVKDLRESLDLDDSYDDDDFMYKWGMTNNLKRRTKDHEKTYGEFEGANLELVLFGYIDPQYISEAETRLAHCFKAMNLVVEHETYEELAIIPKEQVKYIREQCEMISGMYMGHVKDLIIQIKNKDHEIAILKLKHENDILKKDLKIANLMKHN